MKTYSLVLMALLLLAATAAAGSSSPEMLNYDPTSVGRGEGRRSEKAPGVKGCLSQELCERKRAACMKACIDVHGDGMEQKNLSAKCALKCKKCVPDC